MTEELTTRLTFRVSEREKKAIYKIFGPSRCVSRNVVAYLVNAKDASSQDLRRKTLCQVSMIYSLIETHLAAQHPSGTTDQLAFLEVILNCRALIETIKQNAP